MLNILECCVYCVLSCFDNVTHCGVVSHAVFNVHLTAVV